MCFDSKTSINSFLISLGSCLLLFLRGSKRDRAIGFCFLFISSIQLCEYYLWKNLHNKKENLKWTKITLINIWIQPLAVILSISQVRNIVNKQVTMFLIIAYSLLSFIMINKICTEKNYISETVKSENGHLIWSKDGNYFKTFPHQIIYYVAAMILSLVYKESRWIGIAGFATLGMGQLKTLLGKKLDHSWLSLWCYFGSMIPVFYMLLTF
jgi:hypothetical protein